METPIFVSKLSTLLNEYDFFILDIHGVVHNGINGFESAIQCVNNLSEQKSTFFVSNNPRPNSIVSNKLISLGISNQIKIITSGDLVRELLLNKYNNKRIYHLGSNVNTEIAAGLNLNFVDDVQKSDLILLTLFIDRIEELENYSKILNLIILNNIPVLCANPDKFAPNGELIRFCAGTIAQILKEKGANVSYVGKPESNIYKFLLKKELYSKNINLKKGLMIGDMIETDIQFSKNIRQDSLLVLSGITGEEINRAGVDFTTYTKTNIPPYLWPNYYTTYLTW